MSRRYSFSGGGLTDAAFFLVMGVLFAPIAAVYPSIYVDKFFTWDSVLRFYQIFGIWLILLNLFAVTAKGHGAHSILEMRDLCRHVAMHIFEVVKIHSFFLMKNGRRAGVRDLERRKLFNCAGSDLWNSVSLYIVFPARILEQVPPICAAVPLFWCVMSPRLIALMLFPQMMIACAMRMRGCEESRLGGTVLEFTGDRTSWEAWPLFCLFCRSTCDDPA